jgi:glycosyltransferase involved in cell wall biosynthesis
VIGADEKKVKDFIDEKFIINLPVQSRDKMPLYYNASNLFFSMSRYEGGAPTMVTSEAMTSGCLIITDAEAKQEIIENEKNGIFITGDYKTEAKRILDLFKNRKKIEEILRNSLETIKDLSLDKWGKRYVDVLLNKK